MTAKPCTTTETTDSAPVARAMSPAPDPVARVSIGDRPMTLVASILSEYIAAVRHRHPDWQWPEIRDYLVARRYLVPTADGGFDVKVYKLGATLMPCIQIDENNQAELERALRGAGLAP